MIQGKRKMLVCGIDEVGRGPVFGPMILGCVILDDAGRETLKGLDVKDSKKVPHARRMQLAPRIKEHAVEWNLARISASEIDILRKRMSLNAIEAVKIAGLITSLKETPDVVIVDAADSVADRFRERVESALEERGVSDIPKIVAEHRADDTYVEVSAASIIAKVERDMEIEAIRLEYGEIGSGYPSDEVTRAFMKELLKKGELPDFVRRSWNTVGRARQTGLGDY